MRRHLPLVALALIAAAPATRLRAVLDAYNRREYAAALSGFRALAFEDSAVAETMLGTMYASGRAGRVDPATAVVYWLRAAKRGYPPAQIALARAFADGRGIGRDVAQAYEWSLIAERRSDGDARTMASALAAQLAPRLSAAEQRTRTVRAFAWRPSGVLPS